jgi:hypothetical protein
MPDKAGVETSQRGDTMGIFDKAKDEAENLIEQQQGQGGQGGQDQDSYGQNDQNQGGYDQNQQGGQNY